MRTGAGIHRAWRGHTSAFVLTHAVQGAVDAALVEHPEWFCDDVLLDAFVQDLTRMVVLHATSPADAPGEG